MEVHHHPKAEKKNFKEYFFEFIMIFLAVTMGFIAENTREHIIEKSTVKRNMEMVFTGLKNDTARINSVIRFNKNKRIKFLDTILSLQDKNHFDTLDSRLLSLLFFKSGQRQFFHSNDAAFEQMKSSGTLRFIKNNAFFDSMYLYGLSNTAIYHTENYLDQRQEAASQSASRILIFPKVYDIASNSILFSSKIPFPQIDEIITRQFFNDEATLRMLLVNYYIPNLQRQNNRALALIQFLQKEYNLGKE